ncbi:MAG TPA: tetratricopeptide repeat protein [Candidatus Nitrosotenuis sp.]|nr:tetratricopeptide repeat protein [Candidatus Nitrosotenuis sp.]
MRKSLLVFSLVAILVVPWAAAPAGAEGSAGGAMDQGLSLFYQGNWDGAVAAFDQVLQEDPQNTLALAYILDAYYRKRDINGIISQIEQKAVSSGEDPVMQAHLGMAYFMRGLIMPNVLEEALTEFKQALKDDERCAMAYTGMGLVYFQKRMMPRAKGYFIRALRLNPHDIMALDRLGNIMLVDEKKPEDALQLFQRIVAELPSYPDGYYFMGSALYDLQRYDEAVPYLQRCVEMDPGGYTQGYDAMNLLGDTLGKLGRHEEAVKAYEMALKLRPESQYPRIKIQQLGKQQG